MNSLGRRSQIWPALSLGYMNPALSLGQRNLALSLGERGKRVTALSLGERVSADGALSSRRRTGEGSFAAACDLHCS